MQVQLFVVVACDVWNFLGGSEQTNGASVSMSVCNYSYCAVNNLALLLFPLSPLIALVSNEQNRRIVCPLSCYLAPKINTYTYICT